MRIFLRPARPRELIADIKRVWKGSTSRYKLVFGALSLGITSMIMTGVILQTRWDAMPKGPQLIYAEDFPANRTDAQIQKDQWEDARKRRELADERRRQWQKVQAALSKFGI